MKDLLIYLLGIAIIALLANGSTAYYAIGMVIWSSVFLGRNIYYGTRSDIE